MRPDSPPTLWLITSLYLKPADQLRDVGTRHRAWLTEHYRSGLLLTGGRRADERGGVLLALHGPQEYLEAVFSLDPYVLEGCAEYTFTAFRPGRRSPLLMLDGVPLADPDEHSDDQGVIP